MVLPGVLPSILLSHHDNVSEVHASLVGLKRNLGNVKALGSQMEVHGLSQKDICSVLINSLHQSKGWSYQRFWQYQRKVVIRGVGEIHQEVVVTIWETLVLKEVLLSGSFVELRPRFLTEGHQSDMIVSSLSILNPFRKFVSLNPVNRPVPGILGFNYVKLTIKSECHY